MAATQEGCATGHTSLPFALPFCGSSKGIGRIPRPRPGQGTPGIKTLSRCRVARREKQTDSSQDLVGFSLQVIVVLVYPGVP